MPDPQVARLAKVTVLSVTALALFFAIYSSTSLVSLLLLGYAGVAQFFPGVALGLFWKRVRAGAVFVGLTSGVAIVAFLMLTKRDPYMGLNAGFIGLCVNFAVAGLGSVLAPHPPGREVETDPHIVEPSGVVGQQKLAVR